VEESHRPRIATVALAATAALAAFAALASGCGDGDVREEPAPLPTGRPCSAPRSDATASVALKPAVGGASFRSPIEVALGPGGRLYVLEQAGVVRWVDPVAPGAPVTAIDVSASIVSGGEAGLLGIAFDPRDAGARVYLHFNRRGTPTPGVAFRSVIARFESRDGGMTFDPATEKPILVVDQPFANHNGGKIAFGPDGFLYIGLGDGGSGGDPLGNGQSRETLLGKILRIDPASGDPYAIPADNPFAAGGGRPEIYAYGLRNPWKLAFDTVTGELWCSDVGQDRHEEVDRIVRGGNYGWKVREGKHCFGASTCDSAGMIDPVVEYGRSEGTSITGGYVYRGRRLPALQGRYVFGDFGSGSIWAVGKDATGASVPEKLVDSGLRIASFAQDADGEIYVADYVSGTLQMLVAIEPGPAPEGAGALLSSTGCLDPARAGAPPGMVPYTVDSPLWSDGADKERWLYVPAGAKGTVSPDGDLDLPPGTVAVKTFSIGGRRIETRLFAREEDGRWAGFSYEWNDAQTDAQLLTAGKTRAVGGLEWTFPSRAECLACHTPVAGYTLGLEARQLDRDEAGKNQLARFDPLLDRPIAPGAFGAPLVAASAASATAEARARSYLHANCSMCHREGSGAGAATLDLRVDRPLAATRTCLVPPQAGALGIAGGAIVVPGDPARSVLLARMRDSGASRMPGLATRVVDVEGSAAVEAWIRELTGCP